MLIFLEIYGLKPKNIGCFWISELWMPNLKKRQNSCFAASVNLAHAYNTIGPSIYLHYSMGWAGVPISLSRSKTLPLSLWLSEHALERLISWEKPAILTCLRYLFTIPTILTNLRYPLFLSAYNTLLLLLAYDMYLRLLLFIIS